jgi:hypothetical protein
MADCLPYLARLCQSDVMEHAEPDTTWMSEALCKGKTELFYPPVPGKYENPNARKRRETQARFLCSQCIVSSACRAYGRAQAEYGIWGGETEDDRGEWQIYPKLPDHDMSDHFGSRPATGE